MTTSDGSISCDRMQDRIETYLDGDMPDEKAAGFDRHISSCATCSRELELARRIQLSLQVLPMPDVPDDVLAGVFEQIRAERNDARRRWLQSWRDALLIPSWRPVAVGALLVVLALIGTLLRQEPAPPMTASKPPVTVSAEDLALAESQARWALAYISAVGRRTGFTVRDDIIGKRVVGSLHRSVDAAIKQDGWE